MVTIMVRLICFIVGVVVASLLDRNNIKKATLILDAIKAGGGPEDVLKKLHDILK